MEALKYEPHYTRKDWEQWEGRWELLGGIPVAMSPSPAIEHQKVSTRIQFLFEKELENCRKCFVLDFLDWIIGEDTIVEPDMLVLCDENGKLPENISEKPPSLLLEVISPSSRSKDRVYKRDLYGKNGVKYYLIADPEKREIEVLENEGDSLEARYRGPGEPFLFDFGFCRAEVDLKEAWHKLPV